jgi:hypothetical protein
LNDRVIILKSPPPRCDCVVVFDAVASVASLQIGFKYVYASAGSYLLYATVGFLAARAGNEANAVAAGALIGVVDATVGWAVSWAIGPGRMPGGTLSIRQWVARAAIATFSATICAAVGGFIDRAVSAT